MVKVRAGDWTSERLSIMLGLLAAVFVGIGAAAGQAILLGGGIVVVAAFSLGVLAWRWSILGLFLFLPFSGIPIVMLSSVTAAGALLKDILFVIPAYGGFLAERGLERRAMVFSGTVGWLMAALACLVLLQLFNPSLPNLLVGLIGVRVWLLYLPLYFLGYYLAPNREWLFRILGVISCVALVPASVGILEQAIFALSRGEVLLTLHSQLGAVTSEPIRQTAYESGGLLRRVASTFSSVTQYYNFTMAMVAVAYAWCWGYLARIGQLRVGLVVWLLLLLAAFLTGSRAPFIMAPLLLVLILALEGRLLRGLIVLLVAGAVLAAATQMILRAQLGDVLGYSLELGRTYLLTTFLGETMQAASITVVGLGTGFDTGAARYAFDDPGQIASVRDHWYESWFAKTILELGWLGLAVASGLLALVTIRGLRTHARLRDPALRTCSAAFLAFLLWHLFNLTKAAYIDIDPTNVYFWLLAGLQAGMPRLERQREDVPLQT